MKRIENTERRRAGAMPRSLEQAAFWYVAVLVTAGTFLGAGMISLWSQLTGIALCIPAVAIVVWRATRSDEAWAAVIADRMNLLLALGVALLVVSTTVSVYRSSSLVELCKGIGLVGLFSFSREYLSSAPRRRDVAHLLYWTGVGVSLAGIVLFGVRGSSAVSISRLTHMLLVVDSERLSIGFGYANSFAAFLLVPLAAGLGLVLDAASMRRRAVLVAGSLIMLVAMLESSSRGGLIVLGCMVLAGSPLIVRASGGGRNAWKRLGFFYGALGAVLAVLALIPPLRQAVLDPIVKRLLSIGTELVTGNAILSSTRGRLTMIGDALRYAHAYPILGSGAGTYGSVYMRFRTTMFFASDPHSLPLKILAETGVVGLGLGLAMLIAVFRRFWHSVNDAGRVGYLGVALWLGSAGLLLHACIDWDFAFLAFPIVLSVVCGIYVQWPPKRADAPAGVMSAEASRHRDGYMAAGHARRGLGLVAPGLRRMARPVVACWVVTCVMLLAGAILASAAVHLSGVHPDRALALLNTASSIDPLNAEYPYRSAGINVALDAQAPGGPESDRALAIRGDFERAMVLDRYFPLYRIDYGRFLLRYGLSDAVQTYEDLVKIDPMDPGTYTGLAASYLIVYENVDKAEYWVGKALTIDAAYAEAHLVKGMVFEKRGDVAKAATEYQKTSELDTTGTDALLRLAAMEREHGDLRAASRALSEANVRAPRDASVRSALAAIAPVVDVSEPQADYQTSPGQELVLGWDVTGQVADAETWNIYLVPASGEWTLIATDLERSVRSWTWQVPKAQASGKYCLAVYARAPSRGADTNGDWLTFGRSGVFTVRPVEGH